MKKNANGWTVKNPNGTAAVICTVEDLIKKVSPNFNFALAAASSFVFLGTADEFARLHGLLESDPVIKERSKCTKTWLSRSIVDCYKRTIPSEKEKYIVVMEGDEIGPFWLRCEFEDFLREQGQHAEQRQATP